MSGKEFASLACICLQFMPFVRPGIVFLQVLCANYLLLTWSQNFGQSH